MTEYTKYEDLQRLDALCASLGIRFEDIQVEHNDWTPEGYDWAAWVGEFNFKSIVGTGRTPEAAIEDLLDMLGDKT